MLYFIQILTPHSPDKTRNKFFIKHPLHLLPLLNFPPNNFGQYALSQPRGMFISSSFQAKYVKVALTWKLPEMNMGKL